MPCARLMLGLLPVARMPQPVSVPKNQYKSPIMTATKANRVSIDHAVFSMEVALIITYCPRVSTAVLACPIILRFTDHRMSWVKIPERIAGMPMSVWKIPVTSPASAPATTATSTASQAFTPAAMSTAHTAPPVHIEPSTVKSAKSSTL